MRKVLRWSTQSVVTAQSGGALNCFCIFLWTIILLWKLVRGEFTVEFYGDLPSIHGHAVSAYLIQSLNIVYFTLANNLVYGWILLCVLFRANL